MEEAQSSIFLFERIWIIGANSSQPDSKNESNISTVIQLVHDNCVHRHLLLMEEIRLTTWDV